MTTKIKNRLLRVDWRYSPDRIKTTCFISLVREGAEPVEMASVTIHRFAKDQFEYEKARKVSMKRALVAADLEKDERAQMWGAYFARKAKK